MQCSLGDEGLELLCAALGGGGGGSGGGGAAAALEALDLQECWQVTEAGLRHLSREQQQRWWC